MNKLELQYSLEKIYKLSEDPHSIYTSFELCENMIGSIQDLKGDILVISNLEFLIILKTKGLDMSNIYYSTRCPLKKRVAINLGVSLNNILELEYNKKVNIATDMKFDIIIQNPPYNPNSLWKKFVEKGIDLLKEGGKMIAIHPEVWRKSSTHNKLCRHLKEHISELHMTGFTSFPGIGTSTDWYVYNKDIQYLCSIFYENADTEIVSFDKFEILSFSKNSIPGKIISKICTVEDNGLSTLKGWDPLYTNYTENGIYKQCGGVGRGTSWTNGDFHLTNEPTNHQYENKVVMSYTRRPRATFFSSNDKIGVLRAHYWLTDNQSLPILLNSKMIWKLGIEVTPQDPNIKTKGVWEFPVWFLKSLNFKDLNIENEKELYKHFNLTEKEITWIEND
jgi:hypothetical protein